MNFLASIAQQTTSCIQNDSGKGVKANFLKQQEDHIYTYIGYFYIGYMTRKSISSSFEKILLNQMIGSSEGKISLHDRL